MDGNISHKLEPYRNYHNPITCLASLQPSLILSSHRQLSSARERKTFLSRECAFSSRIPRCIALRNLSFLYTWNEYNCIGISKRPTYVHLLHDPRTLDSLFKKLIEWLKFFFLFFFCKEDLIYEFRRLNFAKSKVLISINVLIFLSFSFCDHFKERLNAKFLFKLEKTKTNGWYVETSVWKECFEGSNRLQNGWKDDAWILKPWKKFHKKISNISLSNGTKVCIQQGDHFEEDTIDLKGNLLMC